MSSKRKKLIHLGLLATIGAVILFIPNNAYARFGVRGAGLGNITPNFFNSLLSIILSVLGSVLSSIMNFFQWLLSFSIGFYQVGIVDAGWRIMRDFANMFFIVALIIMAFATIFNTSKYSFGQLVGRFVVAAVMMNFSLVLCKFVLQFSDVISNVFLTALGDVSGQLGQGLGGLAFAIPGAKTGLLSTVGSYFDAAFTSVTSFFFSIIFVIILIISMGTAAGFIFVRIPILWYIMIFAPIAVILSIFPGTKKSFDSWLSNFLGWTFYLPVFLFYLYFGMYFVSRMPALLSGIGASSAGAVWFGSIPFQVAFTYFLACFFVLSGVKMAGKVSWIASASVVENSKKPFQWASEKVGATGAWQARKRQFQEEGLPGRLNWLYGGKQGQERAEAKWGRLFGVRGMETAQQRQFIDRVKKETEDIQQKINNGDLKDTQLLAMARSGTAKDPRTFAARRIIAQRGQLDATLFRNTIKELGNNRLAAQDFAKAAKESDFSAMSASDQLSIAADTTTPIPVRKEMYSHIASKPKILSQIDTGQVNEAISVLGGATSKAGKDFLEALGKNRPDRLVDFRLGAGLTGQALADRRTETLRIYPGLSAGQIRNQIYRAAITSDAKAVAGFSVQVPGEPPGVWDNADFQMALRDYVSRLLAIRSGKGGRGNAAQNYVNKLVQEFANDPNPASGAAKQNSLRTALTGLTVTVP